MIDNYDQLIEKVKEARDSLVHARMLLGHVAQKVSDLELAHNLMPRLASLYGADDTEYSVYDTIEALEVLRDGTYLANPPTDEQHQQLVEALAVQGMTASHIVKFVGDEAVAEVLMNRIRRTGCLQIIRAGDLLDNPSDPDEKYYCYHDD